MTSDQRDQIMIEGETPPTRQELALLLRSLRRRHARTLCDKPMGYRELAARTGWGVGTVSDYFTGNVLPPTDRFDVLVQLLGASPAEQRAMATFRDRVEESQLRRHTTGAGYHARPTGFGHDGRPDVSPRIDAIPGQRPTETPRPLVPRQVPAPPVPFVGRGTELAALTTLADQAVAGAAKHTAGSARTGAKNGAAKDGPSGTGTSVADGTTATVPIAVISGMAGIGKTSLVLHWAHQAADRFPDGQLYVNLRGFDPTGTAAEPAEAIRRLLDALQVPATRIPGDLDSQTALYRSLLAGRRTLVVLDNANDAGQLRPLLPATAGCMTVVTSRNQLTPLVALDGAIPFHLDLLTAKESRSLLASRLGTDRFALDRPATDRACPDRFGTDRPAPDRFGTDRPSADRLSAERAAVDAIVDGCARLPLALGIAAAMAQSTGFTVTAVAAELAMARRRLDALNAGDAFSEVRAVFSWSYTALSQSAARMFRLLGSHPGPDTTVPAAASLAGVPVAEARRQIAELADAGLVVEPAAGRFGLHDLLRVYATELIESSESPAARDSAIDRLLDHYIVTAHAADRLLLPTRDPIKPDLAAPASGVVPESLADAGTAMAWLSAEHSALLASLRTAAETGRDRRVAQLAWSLNTYLHRQGHWHELMSAWTVASTAAGRLGDPAAEATAHRLMAHAASRLRRHAEARHHLGHALEVYLRCADRVGQADTHRSLTVLYEQEGQLELALDHAELALRGYRAAGHRHGQAVALNAVGWFNSLLGDQPSALARCDEAMAIFSELDDRDGRAHTSDSIANIHRQLGSYDRAVEHYRTARDLFRELGDRYSEARVLGGLADTHQHSGNLDAAVLTWNDALAILIELDHPDADQVRERLAAAQGRPADQAVAG